MKKLAYTSTVLFLLVALTIWLFSGCEKNSGDSSPYKLEGMKILEKYDAGKLDYKKGEYLKGSINIYSIDANTTDFYLKSTDGQNIHYILQSEIANNVQADISSAEVLFLRRSMVVNSLDSKQTILVTIDGGDQLQEGLQNIPFDAKYEGYGLARK